MERVVGNHQCASSVRAPSRQNIGRVLVTGGTGFIGGAVLAKLLVGPYWSKSVFLVRAPTVDAGHSRLAKSIERFYPGLNASHLIDETQVIRGGLEDVAALGHEKRLDRVTHVIHAAAVTSFSNSPRIRAINIDASLAFVDLLVRKANLKRFLNVGTAWCVGTGIGAVVAEGRIEDRGEHLVPYTRSKLEFERAVRQGFPSLPFVTARPSIVVGHTRYGTRPSGSIYWVFQTAALIGCCTCPLDERIDVVPVDWVAKGLVYLATKPTLKYDAYHLSAGVQRASTFEQIDLAIARGRKTSPHGRSGYRRVDEEQLAKTIHRERKKFGGANPTLLSRAMLLYGRFASSGTVFDNARALEEGISPPPAFHTYADTCAATSEHSSIAEQMEDDFK